jgi:hypothetical protein
MREVTYCIPTSLIDAHRGRRVVVRAPDVETLTRAVPHDDLEALAYFRLPLSADGPGALREWGRSVPVDLIIGNPAEQFPQLYRWAVLLDACDVRVSLPARPGFSKAARLAASLRFDIKLEIGQPGERESAEIQEVLEFYLHGASVHYPVEPFQSLLAAFCRGEAVSLWSVQEEDPAEFREVLDDGTEVAPGRLADAAHRGQAGPSVDEFEQALLASGAQCAACEFRPVCRGFFKAPCLEYPCNHVQPILGRLKSVAAELRRDVQACRNPDPGASP